jgi:hypothetical protein
MANLKDFIIEHRWAFLLALSFDVSSNNGKKGADSENSYELVSQSPGLFSDKDERPMADGEE